MLSEETRRIILQHFQALDFWRPYWEQSAVVVVGSSVRGVEDQFTDIDVLAFVPQAAYPAVYQSYRNAVDSGRLEVLNPNAFLYQEFPLALISTIKGHYKVHTFEEVEDRVKQYDDVTMWIHSHSVILHDPTDRYARLRERCQTYPEDVWREKTRFHFLKAYDAAISVANPLRRNDEPTVRLLMVQCVTHLLRFCCLLDRRPFPYDKWLYREALQTQAGRDLQPLFESFFEEIRRPEIRRVEPASYERPDHRNADLEAYPLHLFWRHAKNYFDAVLKRDQQPENRGAAKATRDVAETTAPRDRGTPLLAGDQALAIAQTDAAKAYRDLTGYRICLALEEDGWHVDYELKDPKLTGGGPHYVIDASTGTILSKRYEQ